jgi:hypothetical protein
MMLNSCADYNEMEEAENPTPVTLSIAGTGDSSVTLKWSKYAGEYFSNYGLYIGYSQGLDSADSLIDTFSYRTDTVATIRKLTPNTHYYFRVIVTTTEGGAGASNVVDTTVNESTKHKLTLYPPDSTLTDTTVFLRWTKYGLDFDYYRIYRDTTDVVDTKDTSVKTVYTDTSATIKNLMPGRTYWFRVYAFSDTSIAATSNIMEVQTADNSESWSGDITVTSITDTTATLKWTKYASSDFKNYKVYFSLDPTVELTDSLEDSLVVKTDTSMIVRSLVAATTYTFRVMVTTIYGDVFYSDNVQATTTNVTGTTLKLYGPDEVDSTLVVLHWSPCKPAPDSYWLYRGSTQFVSDSDTMAVPQCIDTFVVVKNLAPNTVYWFKVYARTGADIVASSNAVEVLTSSHK